MTGSMLGIFNRRIAPTCPEAVDEEVRSMAAGLVLIDRMVDRGDLTRFEAEARRGRVLQRAQEWGIDGLVLLKRRSWS